MENLAIPLEGSKVEKESKNNASSFATQPPESVAGEDGYIRTSCEVSVRLKPLGTGKSDTIVSDSKWKIKKLTGNIITMGNLSNNKRDKTYKCFRNIVPGNATQGECFDTLLSHHIANFVNGYNVTYLAYGQTGGGKTYTVIAPVGSFKNLGADESGEVLDHYGLFPRAALCIYHALQKSGKKYVLTCNI